MNQTKINLIKQYLIDNGKITSWTAIDLFRATRLSAIIYNLRKDGWNIQTKMSYVDGSCFATYIYHKESEGEKDERTL